MILDFRGDVDMSVLKPASYFFQTTKAFLPTMLEINHGHIVTVASSLGLFSTAGVEVCQLKSIFLIHAVYFR